ncbi:MAG: sigma-70 family RNA polymerase sigma factor [Anaerolineae bacterium]|nr:sigma-70 family RNA polymerase sigma factor [Anaerolineae bacterium]
MNQAAIGDSDLSDADLVERAQQGEINAVGELYDRHYARIFRYLWSRVGSRPVAEDLAGQVFLQMVKALSTYRWQNVPFQAWLYRIAHNLMVDYVRKQSPLHNVPLYEASAQ